MRKTIDEQGECCTFTKVNKRHNDRKMFLRFHNRCKTREFLLVTQRSLRVLDTYKPKNTNKSVTIYNKFSLASQILWRWRVRLTTPASPGMRNELFSLFRASKTERGSRWQFSKRWHKSHDLLKTYTNVKSFLKFQFGGNCNHFLFVLFCLRTGLLRKTSVYPWMQIAGQSDHRL